MAQFPFLVRKAHFHPTVSHGFFAWGPVTHLVTVEGGVGVVLSNATSASRKHVTISDEKSTHTYDPENPPEA